MYLRRDTKAQIPYSSLIAYGHCCIKVLVGNPKAGSRTRAIAEALAERIAALTGAAHGETIELAEHAAEAFAWPSPALDSHALAVEHTLRPLLVELGASVPTRGLSFPTQRFDEHAELLDEWIAAQAAELLRAAAL